MKLPHRAYLQVHSDAEAVPSASTWFANLHQPTLAISEAIWLQCQTAFYEGLTNVVRHAHAFLPQQTPIEIEVTLKTDSIVMCIWDHGKGFNLEEQLQKPPPTDDAESGRGLLMIQKIADSVSYTAVGDRRNRLMIVKHY